jgi:hypothetical protein
MSVRIDQLLTRRQLVGLLTEHGYPVTLGRLLRWGPKGPPPEGWWSGRLLYDPDRTLKWAQERFRSRSIKRSCRLVAAE